MTCRALAQASGVSETHVRDYLAGRKSMATDRLQHVLRVLHLTIAPTVTPR